MRIAGILDKYKKKNSSVYVWETYWFRFVKTKNGKHTDMLLLNTLITYCSLKAMGKINSF